MPRIVTRALAALALAGSSAAFAAEPAPPQPTPAGASEGIVVTGHEIRDTQRRIGTFVNQITRAAGGEDLARFVDPVCPAAFGLTAERKAQVVARMRQVAKAAGVPLDKPKCMPNVLVMVVPDKRALIEGLAKQGAGRFFGELSGDEIHALAVLPGRAASWVTFGPPISARGVELYIDPGTGLYMNQTTEPASRLHSAAHPQYYGAAVVIEASAIDGLSITQLADYAAMRTFAGAAPKWLKGDPAESILLLIDAPAGSEVPLSLTRLDLGFLRGLYASPADATPSSRRAAIRAAIAREVGIAVK